MKHIKLFENFNQPKIEKISEMYKPIILDMVAQTFSELTEMNYDECIEYTNEVTDFSKSVKLILNEEIIGCYLISEKKLKKYKNKIGLEGIGLVVLSKYRGKGYGEILKNWFENYAKSHNYDFIFGQHLKSLKNLEPWLKRRKLYSEDVDSYYTIKWITEEP